MIPILKSLPHSMMSESEGSIGKATFHFHPPYFPPATSSIRSTPLEQDIRVCSLDIGALIGEGQDERETGLQNKTTAGICCGLVSGYIATLAAFAKKQSLDKIHRAG